MRAAKADRNQPEIVAALRMLGVTVQHLHKVGEGCPDILCGVIGKNVLMEIKDGEKIPSKRKLNNDQVEWHKNWRGQVAVVETVDQAIEVIQKARKSVT